MTKSILICLLLTCFVLLFACSSRNQIKLGTSSTLIDLMGVESYQFNGKMSFSDGQEGGSGQVTWRKDSSEIQVNLRAPLSTKSWSLTEGRNQSAIQMSSGEVILGQSAQQLISEQVGWEIPWDALKYWVIGQPSDAGQVDDPIAAEGFAIKDQGWYIQYSRLKSSGDGVLHHKVIAKKEAFSIKLIIKKWQW